MQKTKGESIAVALRQTSSVQPEKTLLHQEDIEDEALTSGITELCPHPPWNPVLLRRTRVYTPRIGDCVIGVVGGQFGESWRVDIRAPEEAILNHVSFESATKSNHPNLKKGAVVMAMVKCLTEEKEVELTCENVTIRKSFSSNEAYLGELKKSKSARNPSKELHDVKEECSVLLNLPFVDTSTYFLGKENLVLDKIGEYVDYEVAVGRNGRVWVSAGTPQETMVVSRCISLAVENPGMLLRSSAHMQELCRTLCAQLVPIEHRKNFSASSLDAVTCKAR